MFITGEDGAEGLFAFGVLWEYTTADEGVYRFVDGAWIRDYYYEVPAASSDYYVDWIYGDFAGTGYAFDGITGFRCTR